MLQQASSLPAKNSTKANALLMEKKGIVISI
jgi:hypothetical protein